MSADHSVAHSVAWSVNGSAQTVSVAAHDLLIDVLRRDCGLTSVHSGCDTAQCGACTVIRDGKTIKACNVLALQCIGSHITTVEGLHHPTDPAQLHPLQTAFLKHHGLQCGYCTPGMLMRSVAMIDEPVPANPDAVRHALSGNLCRCTGYQGIVDAVCEGLTTMRAARGSAAL